MSRAIDFDDYAIHDDMFRKLDCNGDPTEWTGLPAAITPRFRVSIRGFFFCQPGTEAVDVFAQNWDGENNWILPPVLQVSRVIAHAGACKAVGTLVIPVWKSSYFWLLLCEDGKHWNPLIE